MNQLIKSDLIKFKKKIQIMVNKLDQKFVQKNDKKSENFLYRITNLT